TATGEHKQKKKRLRRQQAGAMYHWRCPAHWAHQRRVERHGTQSPHTGSHTTGTDSGRTVGRSVHKNITHRRKYISSGSKNATTHHELKAQAWKRRNKQQIHTELQKILNLSTSQLQK
ncbi:hypothetical protein TcCL_NonESM04664, partial [Trypanosoma cruzi]